MQTRLQLSRHASERSHHRTTPACVLELLQRGGGTDFSGRHPNHPRLPLRIVRTADSYWIAPHQQGVIITVYEKHESELDAWARQYLHFPEQNRHRLRRLPRHRTAAQQVTAELWEHWGVSA
jgi:hypothetical protein